MFDDAGAAEVSEGFVGFYCQKAAVLNVDLQQVSTPARNLNDTSIGDPLASPQTQLAQVRTVLGDSDERSVRDAALAKVERPQARAACCQIDDALIRDSFAPTHVHIA